MSERETRKEILDAAERLVRQRGYNGFSYRDLADEIGIKTASIHYHFPAKGDLGEALAERELEVFGEVLARLDVEETDPRRRLERFVDVFKTSTIGCANRMCLGAMLAVEQETLPDPVQQAVRRLFEHHEGWLAGVLQEGLKRRQFHFNCPSKEVARALFAHVEGALLTARAFHDVSRFDADVSCFLTLLGLAGRRAAR
jgi:TetR/AcrR family transcriptional regulator, transcriptional repressor for nem operon